MSFIASCVRMLLLAGFSCLLAGCLPTAENQSEEQLEAHFQAGKSRVNAMDFKGATESFERALEVNPQNASAHFELGWLYDQKEVDSAAAIYHYNKYLKLRPRAGNAEMVRARVVACQQELASTVSLSPATQVLQKELQQMAEQNRLLREELDRLRTQLQSVQGVTNPTSLSPGTTPVRPPARRAEVSPDQSVAEVAGTTQQRQAPTQTQNQARTVSPRPSQTQNQKAASPTRTSTPGTSRSRYHSVQAGETTAAIARKYGLSVEKLLQANPRLDRNRPRTGQTVVIPGS